MNRSLHLFSAVHRESRLWPRARCTHKMIRYCGGKTLIDIFAEKFRILAANPLFRTAWVEVPGRPSEDDTAARINRAGAPVRRAGKTHYSTLRHTTAEYVVWVNACLPFLRIGTVLEAVNAFLADSEALGLTTVRPLVQWLWDAETHKPLTVRRGKIRLQESRPVLESTHMVHIYPRKFKLATGGYWGFSGPKDPLLFTVPSTQECLDVDSELDFRIVDSLMEVYG